MSKEIIEIDKYSPKWESENSDISIKRSDIKCNTCSYFDINGFCNGELSWEFQRGSDEGVCVDKDFGCIYHSIFNFKKIEIPQKGIEKLNTITDRNGNLITEIDFKK